MRIGASESRRLVLTILLGGLTVACDPGYRIVVANDTDGTHFVSVEGTWVEVRPHDGGIATSGIGVLEGSIEIAGPDCQTEWIVPIDTQDGILRIDGDGAFLVPAEDAQGAVDAVELEPTGTCIGRVQAAGASEPSGAPTILFIGGADRDPYRIGADGSGLEPLVTTEAWEQNLTIGAGGRIVVDVLTEDQVDVGEFASGAIQTTEKDAWGAAAAPTDGGLAFMRGERIYDNGAVTIQGADGVETVAAPDASTITWSPDGQWLALEVIASTPVFQTELWVVRPDGRDLHRLTSEGRYGRGATWSPNGTQVAYTMYPISAHQEAEADPEAEPSSLPADGPSEIWIFDVDASAGSTGTPLQGTPPGGWAPTDWTERGLLVELYGVDDDPGSSIAVVDVGSRVVTPLSRPARFGSDLGGRWSPDRSQVLFMRGSDDPEYMDLWVMDADGSDAHIVTTGVTEALWESTGAGS